MLDNFIWENRMIITDIVLFEVSETRRDPPPSRSRQALPMDVHAQVEHPSPPNQPQHDRIRAQYVEIQTDEGISGLFGPIQAFQAVIIATELRPFLIGRDALATELLLDLMLRLNRHGRSGYFVTAISAVDCALWDLKGKAWDQPVYRLLGGPTRPSVPAYASMLGHSIVPEEAASGAHEYQAMGYGAQKWFFRYGPGDGADGMAKNLNMARAVREAVGPHYPLMFDAFMSWDVHYATQMVQALEPLNPTWMEEPLPPERLGEFVALRQASRVPIATGEHVYTRWQTKELLVNNAVDFLQNDPDWTGGISELVKVATLASAFGVRLIAHGHSLLPALHVAASQSPAVVPMVEFLVYHQPTKQHFHSPRYGPENGEIRLPDLPGLGLVLDESKIEQRTTLQY